MSTEEHQDNVIPLPGKIPPYLGVTPDPKQTFVLLRRRCPTCGGHGSIYAPLPDRLSQRMPVGQKPDGIVILGSQDGYSVDTRLPCPSCTRTDPTLAAQPANPWGQGWFDEWVTLEQFKEINNG